MRKEIREKLKARNLEIQLKKLEGPQIKEDLTLFLKAEFYSPVPSGRYAGRLGIEALPALYRDVVFGITGVSKQQQATIIRLMDQFIGRGEVAAEQKEIAGELGPKVVYVSGSKRDLKTIDADIVPPRLEEKTNDR